MQSASYSSTAGALLTPVSSTYGSAGPSESSTEQHPTASPRSASDSTTLSAYEANYSSATVAASVPPVTQPISPHHPSALPSLQGSGPAIATAYINAPSQYAYHSHQQPLMIQPGRASWEYAPFLDPSPATGISSDPPAIHYQRCIGGMSMAPDQDSHTPSYRHHNQQTSHA